MVADFFQVDVRTIGRYIEQNNEELAKNGYQVLRGQRLKGFIHAMQSSGKDINVPTKTTVLGVFDFRAFLNIAMLSFSCCPCVSQPFGLGRISLWF